MSDYIFTDATSTSIESNNQAFHFTDGRWIQNTTSSGTVTIEPVVVKYYGVFCSVCDAMGKSREPNSYVCEECLRGAIR